MPRCRAARAAALAVAAAAALGAAPTAGAAPFVAHLSVPGHHPRAGHRWPVTVTAHSHRGAPLAGRVDYEYLYGGRIVSRQPGGRLRRGRWHDAAFTWPARSIGYRLTLRAVVRTRLGVVRLPYWVVVRR